MPDLPIDLVARIAQYSLQVFDKIDLLSFALTSKRFSVAVQRISSDPEAVGRFLGHRFACGELTASICIGNLAQDLANLCSGSSANVAPATASGNDDDDAAQATCALVACEALCWRRFAAFDDAQLLQALQAALAAAGAPPSLLAAVADGADSKAGPVDALAGAFTSAAAPCLGGRAPLLAVFAAAGGRAALARALAAVHARVLPGADPELSLGLALYDFDHEDGPRREAPLSPEPALLNACAAAAARRGHAAACQQLVAWAATGGTRMDQLTRFSARAAAVEGHFGLLEALCPTTEMQVEAFRAVLQSAPPDAARRFVSWCRARGHGRAAEAPHPMRVQAVSMRPRDVAAICVRPEAGTHLLSLLLQLDAERLQDGLRPPAGGATGESEGVGPSDDVLASLPWTATPQSARKVAAAMVAAGAPPECLGALLQHVARAWPDELPATVAAAASEVEALQDEASAVAMAAMPTLHVLLNVLMNQPARRGAAQGAAAPGGDEATDQKWETALRAAGRTAVARRCGDAAAAVLAAEARLGLYRCLAAEYASWPSAARRVVTASVKEWLWALSATAKPRDARGNRERGVMCAALARPPAPPPRKGGRRLEDLLRAGCVGEADELAGRLAPRTVAAAAARALGLWPGCLEPGGVLFTGHVAPRGEDGASYDSVWGKRGLLHQNRQAGAGLAITRVCVLLARVE
jgi:hypothetical protein